MIENRSLDEAVQQGKALAAVQLADGLCLDLADTLTGDAEIAAHLFQRAGTAIVQTEAETDDLLFTRGQALEGLIDLLGHHGGKNLLQCGGVYGIIIEL